MIQTLEDMLRGCVLDFPGSWNAKMPLMDFAYNNSYHDSIKMALYKALYWRKCRSPIHWHEVGERSFLGYNEIDQVTEDIEKIRERLQTSVDQQRKYVDLTRRPLLFEARDKSIPEGSTFDKSLAVWKEREIKSEVRRTFQNTGENRRSRLPISCPPALARVHDIFHVFMLRKYVEDPCHVLSYKKLDVVKKLCYEEKLIIILDRKDKVLRNKTILLLNISWSNHKVEEVAREPEEQMKELYLQLF
ncbi:uncharacterized protein LOC133814957 [Humulus lupulus]|uniref:uncharacterized protein LOC133814957 n=1 Tax=Humulus lupulus TaxID=3486 RepID=UPI002B4047E8|nr:uncharacterized protein LOC133814957 [Humulus lupulus]